MTTTLQCTHSPIAMTTTHFVVCHNDQSPITNNNISTAKFLGITLELLCIAFLAPLHWSPQVTAIQSLANQCYDIHFQIWCIPQLSKSNYYVLSGHEHLVATKSTPEPAQCIHKQFGCCKSIETMCKDVSNVEYLHCNNEYFVALALKARRSRSACRRSTQPVPIDPPTLPQ